MMQHWSRWNEVHLQKESENTRMNPTAHNRQQRVALIVQTFNKIYYFMFSVFVVVTSDRRLRPQTDRPPTLLHPPPYHLSTTTTTTINQTTEFQQHHIYKIVSNQRFYSHFYGNMNKI